MIGVRHHAPSLAAVVPRLLDAAEPEVLLVELPAELRDWLGWLAHEDTRAPVALAAVPPGPDPGSPAFYPFADFSPELVALRWAARRGVPAVAADLPLADRAWLADRRPAGTPRAGLRQALGARLTGRAGDDLWDRLVEVAAPGSTPEAVRRAALLTGWALRRDAAQGAGVDAVDLGRERWMRARITEAAAGGRRVAAVVGAFHTPALTAAALAAPDDEPAPAGAAEPGDAAPWTVSLIPYTYALLDERSGYPAGIRDPEWQHRVLAAAGDPAALEAALTATAVRVCARLREEDHPAGPADAREITRLATDLARLRGLPAPGRGELIEAVDTVLVQGEPLGRGRAVSRALESVLIGRRAGRPAPDAPRGGLGPAVAAECADLGLPGPDDVSAKPRDLRLDPRRSPRDHRRELLLRRLTVCGIPYAEEQRVSGAGGADAVTARWTVSWTPATAAMLTAASARGVTAAQAAEGTLRERRRAERAAGGPTAAQVVTGLDLAAGCGLEPLAGERLTEAATVLPAAGTLPELLAALSLLDRLRGGFLDTAPVSGTLTTAAVRQVAGLTGSEDPADARALIELAHRADAFGSIRLTAALRALATDGSPLMRGATGAVLVLLGHEAPAALGRRVASWVDAATDPARRAELTARLTGLLAAAGPLLESAPGALAPLLDRVAELPERSFLDRLPALRGGFDTLSPAARDRLLAVIEDRLGDTLATLPDIDAPTLELWTRADLAARDTLAALDLLPPPGAPDTALPPPRTAPGGGDATASPAGRGVGATADFGPEAPGGPPPGGPERRVPDRRAEPAGAGVSAAPGLDVGAIADRTPEGPGGQLPGAAEPQVPRARAESAGADVSAAPAPGGDTTVGVRPSGPAGPADGRPGPGTAGGLEAGAGSAGADAGSPAGAGTGAGTTAVTGGAEPPTAGPRAESAGGGAAAAPAGPVPGAAGSAGASGAPATAAVSPQGEPPPADPDGRPTPSVERPQAAGGLAEGDRWRLVLGRPGGRLAAGAVPLATALDELYGAGRGEGARGDLPGGRGGAGRETPYPSVREWSAELAALFGPGIREEVLAAAAAAGRGEAALALDPDRVRPSVELLRTVLRHAGGLPEARLAQLRPLVRRLVAELTRALATRLRPALTGAALPRPSRRPGGPLDLGRTVRANLPTARRGPDGAIQVIPERPVFRTRARRTADWRLIIVTDVSGSMESSTIWSALTAAVLAGVPTLTTHFLAFSTEVVDLSGHVQDPLSLLLEVRVGGGTHIAAALRHARTLVTAPSRTLVVVVSDFEEGYPLGGLLAEVRGLAAAGCHVLGCASLDDAGRPRYSTGVAGQLVAAGMPVAALSPLELARWVGEKIR
ncbi:VWA domain-containing protein [Streptomyces hainanensis]|uniref:VWA domain-containing protein n=1 Tax=Streptomyces hainanensis TaxID=402648 RepID=A0A4R4TBZ0_9ACTN|nr:VWA domain-containing protein [Streptomyces hainanensis]